MKLTRKVITEIVRSGMTEEDANCFVPVQKLTVAMCMLAAEERCHRCGIRPSDKRCKECEVNRLGDKLAYAVKMPAMFDEDGNLLPRPKDKKETKK